MNLLAIKCQKAPLMSCLQYGEAYDIACIMIFQAPAALANRVAGFEPVGLEL